MKVNIPGHRVLVKPKELETVSKGGIVIARPGDLEKREKAASQIGVVTQVGPMAWRAFDGSQADWKPWAKEGDTVFFVKYAGKFIYDEQTGEEFIVLQDEDILAVIEEA
jgi:co-chaperonin GroES (HSP10)